MLILAAISITMLTGDNSILKRAAEAKERTERVEIIESAKTDILGQIAENKGNDISKKQLADILNKQFKTVDADTLPDEISSSRDVELTTTDERYKINLSEIYIGKFANNDDNEIAIVEGNPAEWETNTEGDKLVKYLGSNENVIFPNKLNGKTITTIGTNVFEGKTDIVKTISISNGITTIEASAFSGYTFLTGDLKIPDSVTTIGSNAFLGCINFNGDLYIGKNVSSIAGAINGSTAVVNGWKNININMKNIPTDFISGTGLKGISLTIGNDVETIGDRAFEKDTSWNITGNLTIGNSVASIGNAAFKNCTGLTGSLNIPDNVVTIGEEAFYNCNGFNGTLYISKNIKNIENATFRACGNLTGNVTLGNKIKAIGSGAFLSCENLESITVPNTVESIDGGAFGEVAHIYYTGTLDKTNWGAKAYN